MSNTSDTLPERVAYHYSALSAAAKNLNSISDEFSKCITEIDAHLRQLNLGVVAWVGLSGADGLPNESWYWTEQLGYAKCGSKWGICLRRLEGNLTNPDEEEEELWLFNDAPRTLRISAMGKIPELLENLSSQAAKLTGEIGSKLSEAQSIVLALRETSSRQEASTEADRSLESYSRKAQPKVSEIQQAVALALTKIGHETAAKLLSEGKWTIDLASVRIEVPARATMIRLTFNAAAEKSIRQQLITNGLPSRFLIVPSESALKASTTISASVEGGQN